MKLTTTKFKNIVLLLLIWFTPFYLAWVAAGAFAHAIHETYYLTLLIQIMVFLSMSAYWTIHLGPKVIAWVGLDSANVEKK